MTLPHPAPTPAVRPAPGPTLRPGLHVVRRDDRHLQVGVDPPWRLVVPDEPGVVRLLADLTAGRDPAPDTVEAHRVLAALSEAGMLEPASSADGPAPRVAVQGAREPALEAVRVLRLAGCRLDEPERAHVVLLFADGELRRDDADEHVRAGRAHLPVAATARGFVLGPMVVAGVTACLRCVDAHLGEHDPRRAIVLEQVADRGGGARDPALTTLAAAWAARDAVAYATGSTPSTWSATVTVGPELEPRRRAWARHPHCGCSWA